MNTLYKGTLRLCLAFAILSLCSPVLFAATRCVDPHGRHGCYRTVSAAVAAAGQGDTIFVEPGTYTEDVVVDRSLSLVGENPRNTIIDASGLSHGVDIDGMNHPGLSHVVVTGFTIENANFSGILITNASAITISNNLVRYNDKNLSNGACPGLPPPFSPPDDLDCGEGIHLSGVDHSTFNGNTVEHNAGGILISDDSGATHDNVLTKNIVQSNVPDCGITLASHSGDGVWRNTVDANISAYNGGAGVGIFAPGPGTKDYANVILNNVLTGNGQTGVAMHNHAAPPNTPPVVFSDNVIVGNQISRNAADKDDATTSGPTGINLYSLTPMPGTIIDENTIFQEALDVAVKIPPSTQDGAPDVQVHLNDLYRPVGVQNTGTATVDATENWWQCPWGPGGHGCSTIIGSGVLFNPWLPSPANDHNHHDH